MREALLTTRQLAKHFPLRSGLTRRTTAVIRAVDGVDFEISAGASVGLVGESGCGKTTFARLCVGLVEPTAGEVLIGGSRLSALKGKRLRQMRRHVQLVFQDPTNSLNPRMTVEEIIAEPLVIHRTGSRATVRNRVKELLETVQLSATYRSRLPHQVSGGERQRVGIARALATDPDLLICDEPIASLDVSVGAQILQLLKTLQRTRQMALLFISHDLRAVAYLCDAVAVMAHGKLIELAPTDQLLDHPRHPYTNLLIRSANLDLSTPSPTG